MSNKPPEHMENLVTYLDRVEEILHERGRKYGPGNIAEFGELGILVRMSDKIARLKNSFHEDYPDETVADTLYDIIGYGLIWLMVLGKDWPCVPNRFPENSFS